MLGGGRPGAPRRRERGRIDGGEIGREQPHEHDQDQQRAADGDGRMALHEADEAAPRLYIRQQVGQVRRDGDARRRRIDGRRVQ